MNNIIAKNKDVYNKIAKHFSDTRSYVLRDLIPLMNYIKSGDRVLDLACGNGRLYQLIEKKSIEEGPIDYLGIDFSKELLKHAKGKFFAAKFCLGTMTEIPCANDEFNVVFCLAAFHHLPDNETRIQALKEIKRVLKSGGILVMTNWNIYSDWGKEKLARGKWKEGNNPQEIIVPWKNQNGEIIGERYYYAFTQEVLKELFEEVGFKVEKQYFAVKKGTGNVGEGMNIVSIICKK